MPEFLRLVPPAEAVKHWLSQMGGMQPPLGEMICTAEAVRRVSAAAVVAPHDLPEFRRSTMDGYALRAADTQGASETLPAYLRVVGEALMGSEAQFQVSAEECVLIHTGGMLPTGANAVVMLEQTQVARPGEIEILKAAAAGENVIQVGEDVRAGDVVIPAGKRLRPAEIGGLMALGILQVAVRRKPRVGIIATGDEILPPQDYPKPGQVRDVNSYSLKALVEQCGGEALLYGIYPDDPAALLAVARRALAECDLLAICAGSSASQRDLTSEIIQSLGEPGVLVHGVNIRPGKPTILAVCGGKGVLGLPGNPVSALVTANYFLKPGIEKLLGLPGQGWQASITARLAVNITSQSGREDWVPVTLNGAEAGWLALPVFSRSNLIFSLVRADGLICIPAEANGLAAGETVVVYPLR